MVVLADGAAVGKAQLDILKDELEDARGEISSLIGQIEGVREDLINGERWVGKETQDEALVAFFWSQVFTAHTPNRYVTTIDTGIRTSRTCIYFAAYARCWKRKVPSKFRSGGATT